MHSRAEHVGVVALGREIGPDRIGYPHAINSSGNLTAPLS
jgi:hypothetical protein